MHQDIAQALSRIGERCNGSVLLTIAAHGVYRNLPESVRPSWSKRSVARELEAHFRTTKSSYGPVLHGLYMRPVNY